MSHSDSIDQQLFKNWKVNNPFGTFEEFLSLRSPAKNRGSAHGKPKTCTPDGVVIDPPTSSEATELRTANKY